MFEAWRLKRKLKRDAMILLLDLIQALPTYSPQSVGQIWSIFRRALIEAALEIEENYTVAIKESEND
jgi:hypothetical protein